ncbi:hypothetical protein ACFQU7_05375 [Pseudoroseomonas wenyumeiae]
MSKTSLHLPRLGRRGLLLGLSAMAVAGQARLALAQPAATPQEARLVVVLLRGALDGLAAVQAYGDADFAALRGPWPCPSRAMRKACWTSAAFRAAPDPGPGA